MSYLDRLKKNGICPSCLLTKPPKGPFVSSGSKQNGVSLEIHAPETALAAFIDLIRAEGACAHGLLFHPDDIRRELDEQSGHDLLNSTREHRQAWARAIAARLARRRIGPGREGWSRV